MLEIRQGTIRFDSTKGGPQTASSEEVFSGQVTQACSALTGIDYGFTDDDHDLFKTIITLDCRVSQNVVTTVARFGLRDNSGVYDDAYDGTITFCIVADVQAPSPGSLLREGLQGTREARRE
jgi:hypothetical protein